MIFETSSKNMHKIEIIEGCQGTPEWNAHRIGSVGASSMSKIITSQGNRSTQRKAFMYQMAAEILTGEKTETFSNKNMEDGLKNEQDTINAFSFITGIKVRQISLIKPGNGMGYHCSPDAIIVGKKEGLEVKSVLPATQVKRLDKGVLPTEYKVQCAFSLMVTNWDKWHFFSYHPKLPPLHIEVIRDNEFIKILHAEINIFNKDLAVLVKKLRQ
jgi:predicted phage-related endonuclease